MLTARHDFVYEPDPQRLLRFDRAAGEDQLESAAHPDQSWESLGAAVDQRHAPAPLEEAEGGALGRALDLILTGRIIEADEAHDWGLLTEVVESGRHLERALEVADALARFPQETMLSDRRSAIEGATLPLAESLEFEAAIGRASIKVGIEGAARFAGGEGRGGEGAGV